MCQNKEVTSLESPEEDKTWLNRQLKKKVVCEKLVHMIAKFYLILTGEINPEHSGNIPFGMFRKIKL